MTQSAENDAPKVLDPNDLGMHLTASGVRVAQVGEDGDVMLMGHHDDRAAWALFAEWRRYNDGEELTWDDSKVYDIERKYAAFSDHSEGCELVDCTCDEDEVCDKCRATLHTDCEGPCLCAEDYDHEPPETWPCSCECYCDEYAWWVSETKSGHEVTWIRWSWAKSKERANVALRQVRRRCPVHHLPRTSDSWMAACTCPSTAHGIEEAG